LNTGDATAIQALTKSSYKKGETQKALQHKMSSVGKEQTVQQAAEK
jgi:hypothetical protein